jgi:hypothetical protein
VVHWRSAVTTARHLSSDAQSSSDICANFSFDATMRGFFIVVDAFFGGMVVGCGGSDRRWDGGEEAGSVREPVGQRENEW